MAVKTASNAAVNFVSRSRTRNLNRSTHSARSIKRLRAAWVTHSATGCALTGEQVHPSPRDLDDEQDVEAGEVNRFDSEEVDRQGPRGLGAQELPPNSARLLAVARARAGGCAGSGGPTWPTPVCRVCGLRELRCVPFWGR